MKSSKNKNKIKIIAYNSLVLAYLKSYKSNNRSTTMKRLYDFIKNVQLVINFDKILEQQYRTYYSSGLEKLHGTQSLGSWRKSDHD